MAKLFSVYATLLLLSISGTLMDKVASDRCKENLGVCDPGCGSRCASTYKGGEGICTWEGSGGSGLKNCWCYYGCNEKTCEASFGVLGCDDKECNSECATRYPQGGHGFCYSIGEPIYSTCRCQYYC